MNLVNEMIKGLLPEEEKKKVVAVYGGGFKPPTSGHFEVAQQALKENPDIDEFIIYIGGKERNGISPDESILIWDIYKQYLPYKVEVKYTSVPPIKSIYNYAKEHPNEEVLFIIGAREGNEEDFKDIASRTTSLDKYPNLNLRTIVTTGGVSGTAARNASKISLEKFKRFVPSELSDEEVEQVFNIVADKIQEVLNENASYSQNIDIWGKIDLLTKHMIRKGMNIEPLPTLELINGDSENAKNFFGKTAYYDPNKQHIVLYTEGRHPKDIVRSYAHEMIHHIQNLEDRLGDISGTNTTENDHLDKLEQEANLRGTMTFRNWTDSLNENLNEIGDLSQAPYKWKTFPKPEGSNDPYTYYDFSTDNGTKYQVVFNREVFGKTVNYDMSFVAKNKDDKGFSADALTGGNEPLKIMSTIVDITREQIKNSEDVDFITFEPTKGKSGEEGAKGNTRSKLYKIIIKKNFPKAKVSGTDTVVVDMTAYKSNDLKEAIVGDKIECDNCDWSWDIVSGGNDLFVCHKCGHDNEPIEENKNKDPFGINAYARELGRLNEKVMDYKIYCDMDGVLVDFESGYEKLTGIDLRGEFQKGDDFWDPISKAGVGFWAGLKWMPGGQELWDYIKPFDPKLLSAPSREQSSRIGKAVWVKHKLPGTKLILRYANQKKELATPESILIDDRQVNIDQWEAAGGVGILHTSASDTIRQLKKLGL
jgi:proteasome assembly chaperone (PAC2) family protein